ncbi:MAG: hypothetical protein AAGE84_06480 [Cyanobacteria bacterium P01_G01_bin.39]
MNNNSTQNLNKFINKSAQEQNIYHLINNKYQLLIGCFLIILAFVLINILILLTDELYLRQALIAIAGLLIIAALNIFKSVREENKVPPFVPSIKLDNRTFINGDYNSSNKISSNTSNQNKIVLEAVAEIQKLLNQSSRNHSLETTQEKMIVAAEVVEEIEKNPTLQARVTSALKVGGIAALGTTLVHPAAGITLAVLSGWLTEQDTEAKEE